MSGAENVCRLLCWLDSRDDPQGRLYDASPADVELAAQWTGPAGLLVDALIATGWIVTDAGGMRWNDYASLNRITITDRLKKRDRRGDRQGDNGHFSGDKKGDKTHKKGDDSGDRQGDGGAKTGASVSGSGDSFRKESPGPEPERPLAPTARAPELEPGSTLRGSCGKGNFCADATCCETGRAHAAQRADADAWLAAHPGRKSRRVGIS